MRDAPADHRHAARRVRSACCKAEVRRVRSEELLRGAREIVIEHDGRQYQLRITQNGKLILTA